MYSVEYILPHAAAVFQVRADSRWGFRIILHFDGCALERYRANVDKWKLTKRQQTPLLMCLYHIYIYIYTFIRQEIYRRLLEKETKRERHQSHGGCVVCVHDSMMSESYVHGVLYVYIWGAIYSIYMYIYALGKSVDGVAVYTRFGCTVPLRRDRLLLCCRPAHRVITYRAATTQPPPCFTTARYSLCKPFAIRN